VGYEKNNRGHFELPPTPMGLGEPLILDMNCNQSSPVLERNYPNGLPKKAKLSEKRKKTSTGKGSCCSC
jgi:hypothetical protein